MATIFRYQPLNSERREIRLIDLAPDATPSHIKLTTRHAALNGSLFYYTLSYTWGAPYEGLSPEWDDPGSTRTISLDGQNFEVRWNLYAALTVLCATPDVYITMWIDAICIDQSNVQERNSQVSLMGEIYKKSAITFVWLGPTSEKFAGVVDMVNTYIQPCDDQFQRFRLMPSHEFIKKLIRLFHCWWFCRTWVVQEIALSQNVILLIGNDVFTSWEWLDSAIILLQQHFNRFTTATDDLQINELPLIGSLMQIVVFTTYFRRIGDIRRALQQNSTLTLTMVLGILRPFMASDARDKVYGALGMSFDCDFIKVDYNSSASEVFIATTQGLLENTGDLAILGLCRASEIPHFPSWAVDFTYETSSRPLGAFYFLDPSIKMYSAGGIGPARLRFENSKTLVISGFRLGVLSSIGSKEAWHCFRGPSRTEPELAMGNCRKPEEQWNLHILQQTWVGEYSRLEAQAGVKEDALEEYAWTQETTSNAFARTLCVDTEIHDIPRRIPKDWNWDQNDLSVSKIKIMIENLVGHVFATTAERQFCLVRDDVQVDDVVIVTTGAEMPWVLRPNGDGTYAFRGFCYVHGFMDGEALRSTDPSATEKRTASSEFRIV